VSPTGDRNNHSLIREIVVLLAMVIRTLSLSLADLHVTTFGKSKWVYFIERLQNAGQMLYSSYHYNWCV
jgi:hypothetical protein